MIKQIMDELRRQRPDVFRLGVSGSMNRSFVDIAGPHSVAEIVTSLSRMMPPGSHNVGDPKIRTSKTGASDFSVKFFTAEGK